MITGQTIPKPILPKPILKIIFENSIPGKEDIDRKTFKAIRETSKQFKMIIDENFSQKLQILKDEKELSFAKKIFNIAELLAEENIELYGLLTPFNKIFLNKNLSTSEKINSLKNLFIESNFEKLDICFVNQSFYIHEKCLSNLIEKTDLNQIHLFINLLSNVKCIKYMGANENNLFNLSEIKLDNLEEIYATNCKITASDSTEKTQSQLPKLKYIVCLSKEIDEHCKGADFLKNRYETIEAHEQRTTPKKKKCILF